ncbi:MAG: adenosylmethionine decarboxylase [Pseudomonadota bacterium]
MAQNSVVAFADRPGWPTHEQSRDTTTTADHFIQRDGVEFAGTHLIADLWGATRLDELDHMETALRDAVEAAGATLLHIHLHHFTPNGGISGVAVLAESHISVHTWPERDFAAFDVFMCGDAKPLKAIDVLKRAFTPSRTEVGEHMRGIVTKDAE